MGELADMTYSTSDPFIVSTSTTQTKVYHKCSVLLCNGGIVLVCLFLAPVFMLCGDMLGTIFHVNIGSVADATAVRFDVLVFNFDVH